jgi:hypothetical protein
VGHSTVLNELAFHPCAIVTPIGREHVIHVTILIAMKRLAKLGLKVTC